MMSLIIERIQNSVCPGGIGWNDIGDIMKKILLTLALTTLALPAFANHPIARATAVATSDHPVAMAAATNGNGNSVGRAAAVAASDNPAAMAVATGNGHHPIARTAVVAGSDHPVAAMAVTSH